MSQALGFALSALVLSSVSVSDAETENARTRDVHKQGINASAGGIHLVNPTFAPTRSGDRMPDEMSGLADDQRQWDHSKSSINSVPSSATRTGNNATPASPLPSSPWPL